MSGVSPAGGYFGPAYQQTGGSEFNRLSFLARQILAGKAFAAMVEVKSVSGGGIGAPATVAVQPMVNQIDGFGNQVPHGTIYNIPCFRLQGGTSAVIVDPVVGDIGEAIICDRDISIVKATGAVSGPGSYRQNDWADGCYFGSFLGPAPTQYVEFTNAGINIVSPTQITLTVGPTSILVNSSGISIAGRDFLTHEHSGVQSGGDDTGPVV